MLGPEEGRWAALKHEDEEEEGGVDFCDDDDDPDDNLVGAGNGDTQQEDTNGDLEGHHGENV